MRNEHNLDFKGVVADVVERDPKHPDPDGSDGVEAVGRPLRTGNVRPDPD